MLRTTAPGNIFATCHGRLISHWETHDAEKKGGSNDAASKPFPSKNEAWGTRKIQRAHQGAVEGWATRLECGALKTKRPVWEIWNDGPIARCP